MVKWIVLGVVLFALLVLVLAVRPVVARLGPLRRAALAVTRRQAQAQTLRVNALALQERLEELGRQAEATQRRVAVIKAKREG